MEISNARIEGTMLGIEDHGILTAVITLDYGGSAQGFGGYGFDYDKSGKWVGSPQCAGFIRHVLEVVGVREWEDLKGKYVRAKHEHAKVHAIGHITEDRWFEPAKDLQD